MVEVPALGEIRRISCRVVRVPEMVVRRADDPIKRIAAPPVPLDLHHRREIVGGDGLVGGIVGDVGFGRGGRPPVIVGFPRCPCSPMLLGVTLCATPRIKSNTILMLGALAISGYVLPPPTLTAERASRRGVPSGDLLARLAELAETQARVAARCESSGIASNSCTARWNSRRSTPTIWRPWRRHFELRRKESAAVLDARR